MPSIRSCVRQFHVSQTSVEHAYAQLQLEGYVRSRPQSGYYVVLNEESRALHTAMLQPSEVQTLRCVMIFVHGQSGAKKGSWCSGSSISSRR